MKLNLWMIANRLRQYDVENRISATTERTISGPLPISAIGSIYVRANGPDVICHSDEGTIIIRDMTVDEGFLLIQSIFNWYDDWFERAEAALRQGDYHLFVHLCAQAFSNPVLLQDSGFLLRSMDCRDVGLDNIPEWVYIHEKGQSSVAGYMTMARALSNPLCKYSNGVCRFSAEGRDEHGREYRSSGLHAQLRYMTHDYGKLTVLEKKRQLNQGDIALLEVLAERSSMIFAAADSGGGGVDLQFMNDLLEGREIPRDRLDYHRSLISGKASDRSGSLCLFLFRVDGQAVDHLRSTLFRQYPTVYSWRYNEELLVIACVPDPRLLAQQMVSFIREQGYSQRLQVGLSLPFGELQDLRFFYEQASFALNHFREREVCLFYECAHVYLLEVNDLRRKALACEPICQKVWAEQPDKKSFLVTVAAYLEQERAAGLAAEQLFIHKNTLNYRVKYMKDYAGWDYEDPALRDYLRLSIYFLSHRGDEKA